MKKILITLLLASLSFNSLADCRDVLTKDIQERKEERKSDYKQYAFIGPVLGVPLIFVSAPLGGSVLGLMAIDVITDTIQIKERKKLIQVIDDAYHFVNTGIELKMLKKMKRKINRKANLALSSQNIAMAIIDSNENGDLCSLNKRNIRKVSKNIAINLSTEE